MNGQKTHVSLGERQLEKLSIIAGGFILQHFLCLGWQIFHSGVRYPIRDFHFGNLLVNNFGAHFFCVTQSKNYIQKEFTRAIPIV